MANNHTAYTMAVLMTAGGVIGYAKKKSVPSLAAGLTLAAVYAWAGSQISRGEYETGHWTALGTSVVLTAAMGARASKLGKFKSLPGGLAVLGVTAALLEAWQLSKLR